MFSAFLIPLYSVLSIDITPHKRVHRFLDISHPVIIIIFTDITPCKQQKTNKIPKDKVEYAVLNKSVKKKRRKKRKELLQETLAVRKGPRQINKHRNKQIIMSMRKDSGVTTSDREEILKNMRRFLQITLYPNSAHTGKHNEIKPRHIRNTRVYRRGS